MNEWLKALGSKIAKKRDEKGMTQAELAGKVGMSTKTLSAMETGSGNQLKKIFKVLYALEYKKPWQAVLSVRIPECSESEMKLHQSLHELLLVGGHWPQAAEEAITSSRRFLPANLLAKAIRDHEIPGLDNAAEGKPLGAGTLPSD